jgi:hypothetical protein
MMLRKKLLAICDAAVAPTPRQASAA